MVPIVLVRGIELFECLLVWLRILLSEGRSVLVTRCESRHLRSDRRVVVVCR